MVLSVHETSGREWRQWTWLIKWVASASILFAVVWWLVSSDAKASLIAAMVPWALAVGGVGITVVWSIALIPLMALLSSICGTAKKKEPLKDSIIQSGGWIPRQRQVRPRTRKITRIALYLLVGFTISAYLMCSVMEGTSMVQEHQIAVLNIAVLALLLDIGLFVYAGIVYFKEPSSSLADMIKNRNVDRKKLN